MTLAEECKTLIVRHLPEELDRDECQDLLKHFGAARVRYMGTKGSMKNTAFASFENQQMAAGALRRLHQLEVFGSRLVVQFSVDRFSDHHPSELETITTQRKEKASEDTKKESKTKGRVSVEKERKQRVTEQINSLSPSWNFEYPFNPKLQYMYPAPTITILMNIANALATVPRFYVQVLHLMNKMNLPAPFGLPTCMPPVPDDLPPPLPPDQVAPPQPAEDMEYSTTEESEMESEEESKKVKVSARAKRLHRPSKKQSIKKKLKLQLQMQAIAGVTPRPNAPAPNATEMFDQAEHVAPKKIEFKLAPESLVNRALQPELQPVSEAAAATQADNSNWDAEENASGSQVAVEVGGFGKIEPVVKLQPVGDNKEEEFGKQEFISDEELRKGRLSDKEMRELSVFKKYETGEQSSRLYIKNLEKHVTEKDLHYIYGRYVDWDVENEKLTYYIQLMKGGRLKGQAFITLPNEEKARTALLESNGFLLNAKPMVVQFSRSAVSKAKD